MPDDPMKIAEFIAETVLRPRLVAQGCLVVYDPERRLRDLCLDMASERIRVVDAGAGSLAGRQAMQQALRELGRPGPALDGLLVYVPASAPLTDQALQANPFAAAAACGAVFPDGAGDDYEQLCLRARPDHQTDIRRLFAQTMGGPAFEVIDAVGGGFGWPQLKAALQVESGREILLALLAPNAGQQAALKSSEGWVSEAREFFKATLGLKLTTRGKTWSALAEEAWRFVLFSEFAFDLPGVLPAALPDALQQVPRAPAEARAIVEAVCESLRTDPRSQPTYVERAQVMQAQLNLPELCQALDDLGPRETFPFEERAVLGRALLALTGGELDAARALVAGHRLSVWRDQEDSQAQWQLVHAALALVQACDDLERVLPEHSRSLAALLDGYVTTLREADRLQREFEQAASDHVDPLGLLTGALRHARTRYRRLAERVQTALMKHVESTPWPPAGRLRNTEVFDRFAAGPLAEQGRRLAYVMVDALRYELGVALERLLADDGPVVLHAACAQLPTVTPVGMASLLPGAAKGQNGGLVLALQADALQPLLGGLAVGGVPQRMEAFRKVYGDRFAEARLDDFARGRTTVGASVDLLVLRSTEIDAQLESSPETALALVPGTLKMIRVALHKLRALGFTDAVIVTDHGFFLNAQAEAGDVCTKPMGHWPVTAHDRMALGAGADLPDSHNLVLAANRLGIEAQGFTQVALPRSLAPYRAGHLYFHGGLSMQEAVVPVLVARLQRADEHDQTQAKVQLSYKNGAKRITTQVPVFDISLVSVGLFSHGAGVEILLEAQDKAGNVVGEARPGGDVNPATRTLMLQPGEAKKIVLRMAPEYRGKLTVKALNPTTLAKLAAIDLETDYTE